MHRTGLIQKWFQQYLPKKDKCWSTGLAEVKNHTVNINDMQGSFFILMIGKTITFMDPKIIQH